MRWKSWLKRRSYPDFVMCTIHLGESFSLGLQPIASELRISPSPYLAYSRLSSEKNLEASFSKSYLFYYYYENSQSTGIHPNCSASGGDWDRPYRVHSTRIKKLAYASCTCIIDPRFRCTAAGRPTRPLHMNTFPPPLIPPKKNPLSK